MNIPSSDPVVLRGSTGIFDDTNGLKKTTNFLACSVTAENRGPWIGGFDCSSRGCNAFSLGRARRRQTDTGQLLPLSPRAGFVKARQATHDDPNPFWEIDQVDLVNGKPYKPVAALVHVPI